jgi:hypothetical protein
MALVDMLFDFKDPRQPIVLEASDQYLGDTQFCVMVHGTAIPVCMVSAALPLFP